MSLFDKITGELVRFRDERDWQQFHDSKNLATAISIEAAELKKLFLCKDEAEGQSTCKNEKQPSS